MESSTEFWRKIKEIIQTGLDTGRHGIESLKIDLKRLKVSGFSNRGHGILKQGIVGEMLIWEMDRRYIQFLSGIEAY